MNCQQCGAGNPDGSVTCSACGTSLAFGSGTVAASPPASTSGLAIAALILGVLSMFTCGITALPALICGIIALVNIANSSGRLKGTGMAITGIVLPGLFIFMIVPMFLAMLMPALSRFKHRAETVVCGANLKGLSTAMTTYTLDYDGRLPTADQWCDLLISEADVSEMSFRCPGAPEGTCSYALNSNVRTLPTTPGSRRDAARLVCIFDSKPGWHQSGGPELLTTEYHGGAGCNVAFADGHVEFVWAEYMGSLLWTTDY